MRHNAQQSDNNSLFTGHLSFQIFLLVGHFTNFTGHALLADNTFKKITQDLLVRCSVIVSDHNLKLDGHFQNLVGQCSSTATATVTQASLFACILSCVNIIKWPFVSLFRRQLGKFFEFNVSITIIAVRKFHTDEH